jgi:hypothetical protein
MSKWPMRGHFRYLRFKTFSMTPRTPQCQVFWAFLSNSKHSGVPEDSKSPTLEVLGFTPTLGQSGVTTFKMNLHCPYGHLKHKLCPRESSGVKFPIWFPATKSQELTWFPCVQATCNIPLKNSWQKLQFFFRPHRNRRFAQEVMRPQSRGSPSCENFGTPTWESHDKKPFGCGPCGELHNIL